MIIPNDDSAWMADALCRQIGAAGGDLWYPEKGANCQSTARKAKRTCDLCSVQNRCLDWALAYDEQWGIWGGVNLGQTKQRHRNEMRRERGIELVPKSQRPATVLVCPGDLRRQRSATA